MAEQGKVKNPCPSCSGTGIISRSREPRGVGVICDTCNGEAFVMAPEFTGRVMRGDIRRVRHDSLTNLTEIPYEEFLAGKMPPKNDELPPATPHVPGPGDIAVELDYGGGVVKLLVKPYVGMTVESATAWIVDDEKLELGIADSCLIDNEASGTRSSRILEYGEVLRVTVLSGG